jgi:hypothetical protein
MRVSLLQDTLLRARTPALQIMLIMLILSKIKNRACMRVSLLQDTLLRARTPALPTLGSPFRQKRILVTSRLPLRPYHLTTDPGSAPLSGATTKSAPSGLPAARIMPSETPNRILRGARLATITT